MRERVWLVAGVLLVAVIVAFTSLGSRGRQKHGLAADFADQVEDLPYRLGVEVR